MEEGDATNEQPRPSGAIDASGTSGGPSAVSPAVPPAPRFYSERECARLQGFPDSYRLEGGKQYVQLGNAVNPLLVRAVGAAVLLALEGGGNVGDGANDGNVGGGTGNSGGGDAGPGASGTQGGETRPCEDFLCLASINLLRGVTPPHGDAVEEGADGWGRYGHEEPQERRQRVCTRPAGELLCMRCVQRYGLAASPTVASGCDSALGSVTAGSAT